MKIDIALVTIFLFGLVFNVYAAQQLRYKDGVYDGKSGFVSAKVTINKCVISDIKITEH